MLVPIALSSGSVLPSPAAAQNAQMSASDDPQVSGPLSLQEEKCDRKVQNYEGDKVAVARRCLRFYTYDPASESALDRDYGALWLQSTVNPVDGWCTTRTGSKIILPKDLGLHSRAPRKKRTIEERGPFTTTLDVTVEDNGAAASIAQDWIAYPRSLKPSLTERVFKLGWGGKTGAKLAFAHGIEISWTMSSPPEGISYRLGITLSRNC
jgi:hypothetical protein